MGIGYQFTDRWAFDYELWYLDGLKMALRGPRTVFDLKSRYWTFVGAAQTFGRFSPRPYPAVVSAWHSVPHVNLGFAGAGPEYFAKNPELLNIINSSELCFLQIMSGRSTSTQLLKTVGYGGVLQFSSGPLEQQRFLAAAAYKKLLEHYGADAVRQQIQEARTNWTEAYRELLAQIRIPVLCVWIEQADEVADGAEGVRKGLLGGFPHLITEEEIRVFNDAGVEIVKTALGHHPAQLLVDYPTRTPVEVFDSGSFPSRPDWSRRMNSYYPTPEMHETIAREIILHLHDKGYRGNCRDLQDPDSGGHVAAGRLSVDRTATSLTRPSRNPTQTFFSRAARKLSRMLGNGSRGLS